MSLDPREVLLMFPGSDGLSLPVVGPKMASRLTSRGPHAGVAITVLEAVEGQSFTVYRDHGDVMCSDGWLAGKPDILRSVAPLLVSDDVDLVCVRPSGYDGLEAEDVFLVELRIGGLRRPWAEMSLAARGSKLRLEPVLHRSNEGVPIHEAEGMLGARGILGRKGAARRIAYWYDTDDVTSPRHGALVHYQAKMPSMPSMLGRMRGTVPMTKEQVEAMKSGLFQPKASKADQKRFKKDMDIKGTSATGAPSKQGSIRWGGQ